MLDQPDQELTGILLLWIWIILVKVAQILDKISVKNKYIYEDTLIMDTTSHYLLVKFVHFIGQTFFPCGYHVGQQGIKVWQLFNAFESRNQIVSEAGKSKQGLEGCIDVTRVVNIPEAVITIKL